MHQEDNLGSLKKPSFKIRATKKIIRKTKLKNIGKPVRKPFVSSISSRSEDQIEDIKKIVSVCLIKE